MKRYLSVVLLLVLLYSCETPRYAYSPTAHNVPVFTNQGDTKLSGSYSSNFELFDNGEGQYNRNRSNGFDLQAAVAATRHFAIQGSYYNRTERNFDYGSYPFDSATISAKRDMFEMGAGYYKPFGKRQRGIFAIYGGVGLGKMKLNEKGVDQNLLQPYTRYMDADLFKYYLEPSMTFRAGDVFTLSLATRFSGLRFRNIQSNYSHQEKVDFNLDSLNRYTWYMVEPCIVNSFGFKKLPGMRIEYQFGLSLLLAEIESFNYRPFNFSLGLVFDIPKLIAGPASRKNKN